MDNRNGRRLRKFYQNQVEQILGLLDKQYKDGQIDLELHYKIAEQTGKEVDVSVLPPSLNDYPPEVQEAFLLHEALPCIWDTNMGYHLGKDWGALGTLLDLYEVTDKKIVVFFLRHIQARHSNKINKDLNAKSKSKAKAGKPK